jgi:AcrR family transcriptional regulator
MTSQTNARAPRLAKVGYHHGNLRASLVQAALKLLDKEGPSALTLRGIAQINGVTQTASAYHFTDKEGLECAIAAACFRELIERLTDAISDSAAPEERLRSAMRAYILYAESSPARFQFMFLARLIGSPRGDEVRAAARTCFGLLRLLVSELVAYAGGDSASVETETLAAWSVVHGFGKISAGSLIPSQVGQVVSHDDAREAVISSHVDGLSAKLAARRVGALRG